MVPVINVPIDMQACFQPPGQGGWMDGRASFVHESVYGRAELKIRQALENFTQRVSIMMIVTSKTMRLKMI